MARIPHQLIAVAEARRTLFRFQASTAQQQKQDKARRLVLPSHVDYAHHLLEPWANLTERERIQLVEFCPEKLKDSPWVPPTIRVQVHSQIRGRKPSESVADAKWVLRREQGRIYGTGDPAVAPLAVVHIRYPFEETSEAETYAALRESLIEGQVGVMIALPEPYDPKAPDSQFTAAYDLFNAAAVAFPGTSLILSSHESVRQRWEAMANFLHEARSAAPNVTGGLTYLPVLSAVGGIGAHSKPSTRFGAASPVFVPASLFHGARLDAGNRASSARWGRRQTKPPGLS